MTSFKPDLMYLLTLGRITNSFFRLHVTPMAVNNYSQLTLLNQLSTKLSIYLAVDEDLAGTDCLAVADWMVITIDCMHVLYLLKAMLALTAWLLMVKRLPYAFLTQLGCIRQTAYLSKALLTPYIVQLLAAWLSVVVSWLTLVWLEQNMCLQQQCGNSSWELGGAQQSLWVLPFGQSLIFVSLGALSPFPPFHLAFLG